MSKEEIYKEYKNRACKNCKFKNVCQEELRIKIDNTIKCDRYET